MVRVIVPVFGLAALTLIILGTWACAASLIRLIERARRERDQHRSR
jgi:hypothetical protein